MGTTINLDKGNPLIGGICKIYGLPAKSNDILVAIVNLMDENNKVPLFSKSRMKIIKLTGKGYETINKYIGALAKKKLLISLSRGLYQAPTHIFNHNLINGKMVVEYDEQNKPVVTITNNLS